MSEIPADVMKTASDIAYSAEIGVVVGSLPGAIYLARAILAERERLSVLKSEDENFFCTPDHAVGEAYLMSCAEAAIMRNPGDRYEIGHKLAEYAAGDCDLKEAMEFMNEDIE